jgi:HK97 gp10 family phage protein
MAALEELQRSLQRPVMRRAATKALRPFLDEVKTLAPVADKEGGALRDSYVIGGPAKLTAKQKGKARRLKDSEVEVYAGTSNPAGLLQELGTVDQPAQPHARPAWDATQDNVLATFTKEMAAEIEKARQRAARKAAKAAAQGA